MKTSVLNKYATPIKTEEPKVEALSPALEMYAALELVSNEAAIIGNMTNYFSRNYQKVNMAVREGFRYLTTWNYDPMVKLNSQQMASFITSLDYIEIQDTHVSQPASFKGSLLPYTSDLVVRAKVMRDVLDKVLKPAAARFGHYLNTPIDRGERRQFEYGINIGIKLDDLIKADAEYFGSGRSATAKFGDLYSSLEDFVRSERNMEEVAAIVSGGNTNEVKRAVDSLSAVATTLIERLGVETDKASKEFVTMLGEELKEVARWVEWYALQMTRIIETNNVIAKIEGELRKM